MWKSQNKAFLEIFVFKEDMFQTMNNSLALITPENITTQIKTIKLQLLTNCNKIQK